VDAHATRGRSQSPPGPPDPRRVRWRLLERPRYRGDGRRCTPRAVATSSALSWPSLCPEALARTGRSAFAVGAGSRGKKSRTRKNRAPQAVTSRTPIGASIVVNCALVDGSAVWGDTPRYTPGGQAWNERLGTQPITGRPQTRGLTNQETAEKGRRSVANELQRRGAVDVTHYKQGWQIELRASDVGRTRTVTIRVKTKTRGNWHASVAEGASAGERSDNERFWVLVDLGPRGGGPPKYFVMEGWIRGHIRKHYDWWLEIHGGRRPVTPGSPHVAIEPKAVERWRDAWEELGIL